jgi:hypothetical protein
MDDPMRHCFRKCNPHLVNKIGCAFILFFFADFFAVAEILPADTSARNRVFKYALRKRQMAKRTTFIERNKGLPVEQISFSGVVDFVALYRNMQQYYPDMSTPPKNLEFTPYPAGSQFNGNFYRQPLIDLIVAANPSTNTSFAIEYAMSHFFTGKTGDTSRKINVQNLLQFHGTANTRFGNYLISAGGGAINYSLSPLTMYNKDFREPMFEKLPWDWYTDSFQKYKKLFATSATTTPSYFVSSATQGFILEGADIPGGFGFSAFYGRSSLSTTPVRADAGYPSEIMAGKIIYGSDTTFKISINYYRAFGYTDRIRNIKDERRIYTAEVKFSSSKIRWNVEAGAGQTLNPLSSPVFGKAIKAGIVLFNKAIAMPVQLQAYAIDKNVTSLESGVLNANTTVVQGGFGTDSIYNNSLYQGYLQEVNQVANNRQGIIFKIDKVFHNFHIELGNAWSEEMVNTPGIISFEHMVNAYPASRFLPWYQYSGPYHRIGNRFRRSIETIHLAGNMGNFKKKFNSTDLSLKFRTNLFGRELLLVNYTYAGSIGRKALPFPDFSSAGFFHMIYEELSAYLNICKRITLLGFYGLQKNQASNLTELSPEKNKPLDQTGTGYGFGIDYDFDQNAGLFLRHRWMRHSDKNFVLDTYRGQETTLELKIFF